MTKGGGQESAAHPTNHVKNIIGMCFLDCHVGFYEASSQRQIHWECRSTCGGSSEPSRWQYFYSLIEYRL